MIEEKVTRIEVIDDTGRVYGCWGCDVELSFQDNGKTLKVFVTKNPAKPSKPASGWLASFGIARAGVFS